MKAVVLFKEGFEEVEALSTVDVLRRVGVECQMVGMDDERVVSSHQIEMKMDKVFDESVYEADVVVIPGGLPGATSLRDDERVIALVKNFNENSKLVAAICAGPIVLGKAGALAGKKYTCYPGFNEGMDGDYQDTLTCVDGNVITGRGPAASFEFAYNILEKMGHSSEDIRKAMQYNYLVK